MSKKHGSTHHIIPKSRGGLKVGWNEKDAPTKEHRGWNALFGTDSLPCEAINKIETQLENGSGHLDKKRLSEKKLKSWRRLFDREISPKNAIEIIKQEWTLKWCFQFKECFKFENPRKICPIIEMYKRGEIK